MRLHAIHHVAHEGLGHITDWVHDSGVSLTETFCHRKADFPSADDFDGLIIMGGSMNADEEGRYPWLAREKELIGKAIKGKKKILGICLGSQLIARCLGTKVYKNITPEIGWFPIQKAFLLHSWFPELDEQEEVNVLHWHSDTYDLPDGAVRLFKSRVCENQAFQYLDHVLALQFHLEMTSEALDMLVEHSSSEIINGPYIHSKAKILEGKELFMDTNRRILFDLLDNFFTA